MRILLWDLVRRQKWFLALLGLLVFVYTFSNLLQFSWEPEPRFELRAIVFLLYGVMFPWSMRVRMNPLVGVSLNPWCRVALMTPAGRKAAEHALWISLTVHPALAAWLPTLAGFLFQYLFQYLFPREARTLLAFIDLPLVLLAFLGAAAGLTLFCQIFEVFGCYINAARHGWSRVLRSIMFMIWLPILFLGVVEAGICTHEPATPFEVTHAEGVVLTIGIVFLSFLLRRFLVISSSSRPSSKRPSNAGKETPQRPSSHWWSAWRWHVVAASAILALWIWTYLFSIIGRGMTRGDTFGLDETQESRLEALLSILANGSADAFTLNEFRDNRLEVVAILTFFAFCAWCGTLMVFPTRVYRALPISSGRFVLRVITFPVAVYAALLAGVFPPLLYGSSYASQFALEVWLSFGVCLAGLAATCLWNTTKALAPSALCLLMFYLTANVIGSPLLIGTTAAAFTVLGPCGMYIAVRRSGNMYQFDIPPGGLHRR